MHAFKAKLVSSIMDNQAYRCTKAHFHPKLDEGQKTREVYSLKSTVTNSSSKTKSDSKVQTSDKHLQKLLSRATTSQLEHEKVAEVYTCLIQLFSEELKPNEKNIQILKQVVEADYPSELKIQKLPVFALLASLTEQSKKDVYYPQLLALTRTSLDNLNRIKTSKEDQQACKSLVKDMLELVLKNGNGLDQKMQFAKYFFVVLCVLVLWVYLR